MSPAVCTRVGDFAHMDRLDLDTLKGHLDALILKVCQGTDAPDPLFRVRFRAAHAAGFLLGGYQFGTDLHDGAEQWADFRARWDAACHEAGLDPKSLPVFLDRERFKTHEGGALMALDKVRAWLSAGRADGYRAGLYCGWFTDLRDLAHDDPLGAFDLWFPWFGDGRRLPPPWATGEEPALWQYTNGGAGPSNAALYPRNRHDQSAFAGTRSELAAWWTTGVRPVSEVRRLLNSLGYTGQDGVREFQRAHPPLAVDGIAGPRTLAELRRVAAVNDRNP